LKRLCSGTWIRVGLGAALVSALGAISGAGMVDPPADVKPEELLARNITRLALMNLRSANSPGPEDYRIAATLMEIAHEQAPGDVPILRRAIETANAANDQAKELELTRELLRIPSERDDTVAQLRVIMASILQKQDADSRLAVYEAYLSGPNAKLFDDSIRSRLALDAAMLLRERGDAAGFVAKLKLAVQLDSTHKEAAALAATYFAEHRPEDRLGALEWLVILLKADPLDPNLHQTMARELAEGGAYAAARRFHRNSVAIQKMAGGIGEQEQLESRVLQWYVDGPATTLESINHELMVQRDAAAREIRRRQEEKQPIEDVMKPDEIRLTVPMAAIAVMAAKASGEDNAAKTMLEDLAQTISMAMTKIEEAVRRGQYPEDKGKIKGTELALQIETLRLWSGIDVNIAKEDFAKSGRLKEAFPDTAAMLSGWLKIRTDDPAGAIEDFGDLAKSSEMVRVGVATALEQLGKTEESVQMYRQVLHNKPLELTGVWARTRLQALGVKDDAASAETLNRIASEVPAYVDRMPENPREFLNMSTEIRNLSPEATERTPVTITIQNLSPMPLALGSDRAFSSRLLLAPKLEDVVAGSRLDKPEVVDIDRRLRLLPREKLTVTIWPDPGVTGWMVEAMANRSFRERWRIVQGFRFDDAGGFQPGPMSLTCETGGLVRRPLPESSLSPDDLAAKIAGDPVTSLPRLAVAMRAFLLQPGLAGAVKERQPPKPPEGAAIDPDAKPEIDAVPPPPPQEAYKKAVDALVARYGALTPAQRALLVVVLPHAGLAPVMAPFDDAARNDIDPLVQALVIATRATKADDKALKAASESPDERLKALARDISLQISGGRSEGQYAGMTPESLKPVPSTKGGGTSPPSAAGTGATSGAAPSVGATR
jgi:tetratricopeptide (TPR) repeat protein